MDSVEAGTHQELHAMPRTPQTLTHQPEANITSVSPHPTSNPQHQHR